MTVRRVAVCEADPELTAGSPAWTRIGETVSRLAPDLLVLNELPFGRWLASSDRFDRRLWDESVALHDEALDRLAELGAPAVVGSRPIVTENGLRINAGFSWTPDDGVMIRHHKRHLPHSPGYHETTWTDRGDGSFVPFGIAGLKVGFMICTDIMFGEHARDYGRQAVDLIVCPRAMPPRSAGLFRAALSYAATVSGCYVASSNRGGTDSAGFSYDGKGMIINPRAYTIARTNPQDTLVTVDIDTENVRVKQANYPCDVD